MSFFRNFSKVLSQNVLNAQKKTYVLSLKNSVQNPVLYYLNQNEPPKDLYQLSLLTYHLAKRTESDKSLLDAFENKAGSKLPSVTSVPDSLVAEYEGSQKLAAQYGDQLSSVLRSNGGDLPIHNAIQALWALESLNKSDIGLYEQHLFPIIREKVQYASLNNLIELIGVLNNLKYTKDTELWQNILKQLEIKFNTPGPEYVRYSGWTLDQYEKDVNVVDQHQTENERYYREVRQGGSEQISQVKRQIRLACDWVKGAFWYRLVQGEGRVGTTLDNFQERLDREALRSGLEGARSAGVDVDAVLGRLRPSN